jgi:PIN domain nuclease of toxin-antitoxin system
VFASSASAWEIAIKSALGKIHANLDEVIAASVATGFAELPVRMAHASRLCSLPPIHRDPFDRLLIAQALAEGLTLVSRDRIFRDYEAPVRWD